jgi:hypothetical protein
LNVNVSLARQSGAAFSDQRQCSRNENRRRRIVSNGGVGSAVLLLMDILASMLAYLVSVAGIIAALVASFVIYFATLDQQPPVPPMHVASAITRPSLVDVASVAELKKASVIKPTEADAAPPPIAPDAQQRPSMSRAQLMRLARLQRAQRLAYRQSADFETRFLHYDD